MKEKLEDSKLKEYLRNELDEIKVYSDVKEEIWTQLSAVNKRKRHYLNFVPYIAIIACLLIILPLGLSLFASHSGSKLSLEEKNDISTIEAVIVNNLTGPKDEWERIMNDSFKGLSEYEEEMYREYFSTDRAYQEYRSYYASSLLIEVLRSKHQIRVIDITFEKTTSKETIYNFSAEIEFKKESSDSSVEGTVRGQANMDDKHKIEKMTINTSDLMKYLSN